jgi:3-oxoacyl-[acyl-carrier protein] reductase
VILVNPSEVVRNRTLLQRRLGSFLATVGIKQNQNETKLRGEEIAFAVKAALEMGERGFIPELSVFATNPKD